MRILLLGDIHGEIGVVNRYVALFNKANLPLDCVLQLGDFGMFKFCPEWVEFRDGKRKFAIPAYITYGNHEDPDEVEPVIDGKTVIENLHVFKRGGEIFELKKGDETIRLLSVGGAPCVDRPRIKMPYTPHDYVEAQERWEKAGKPPIDLLLTHEAPTGTGKIGLEQFGNPYKCGIEELRTLWKTVRPRVQVNGHYHIHHNYEEDGLHHLILDVGQEHAVVLDTETWTFTSVTFKTLTKLGQA
jgi:Icc-related predicted phosphoesterase